MDVDAVVVGSGPNGLVAANDLAEQGWDVLVLEAQPDVGGAVRSAEIEDGYIIDRFSAFYPLAAVSPHMARMNLGHWGLEWARAGAVLAHPTPDGPAALLDADPARTAAALDSFAGGDGDAWLALHARWTALETQLVAALMRPFPPVRAGIRLARTLGARGLAELGRDALVPVRRFAEERFRGPGAALLLAGGALHADIGPDSALGGLLGWMLCGIGQRHGWPVVRTGAGALPAALERRLNALGGEVRCDAAVERIVVSSGRAVAVGLRGGETIGVRRAVLADVVAPTLYGDLLPATSIPEQLRRDLSRYQRGHSTIKVNWSLDRPVPWADRTVARAGTVHLANGLDELTVSSAQDAAGYLPSDPFVLLGQMTTADPTRSPAGTETVWAYTNVPQHIRGDAADELTNLDRPNDVDAFVARIEARIEAFAPGFRHTVRCRTVQTPADMERDDANLLGGDKSLGSAQLHQQLVFRPTIGLGRPETPVEGLYLASASAHPGGGVHGACGANAARAAINGDRLRRVRSRVASITRFGR